MVIHAIALLVLVTTGCATTPQPIIKTEFVKVEVPVVYKLDRPNRPSLANKDIPSYVLELTGYAELLEAIIDGTSIER